MVARAGVVFMFFVDSLMTGRGGASELAYLGQGLAQTFTGSTMRRAAITAASA